MPGVDLTPSGRNQGLCVVNMAVGQAVTTSTAAFAAWDTEREDLPGWFAPGVPTKIIPTLPGLYVVTLQTVWFASDGVSDDPGTGNRFIHIERKAVGFNQEVLVGKSRSAGGQNSTDSMAWVGRLAALDELRVALYQESGGTRCFGGANRTSGNPIAKSTNAEFSVCKIG